MPPIIARLILLLILVPIVELTLLIQLGAWVGTFQVIIFILLTGIAGALLARSQGLGVLTRIRHDLHAGVVPTQSLTDGVLVLCGAVLLIAPGLITDLLGVAFLLPITRKPIKGWLGRRLKRWIEDGSIRLFIR